MTNVSYFSVMSVADMIASDAVAIVSMSVGNVFHAAVVIWVGINRKLKNKIKNALLNRLVPYCAWLFSGALKIPILRLRLQCLKAISIMPTLSNAPFSFVVW